MILRFLKSPYLFLPFLFLFLLQTAPRLWTDSIMRDEAWDLTNGYCYWTQGEVRNQATFFHTPFSFALQSLPLLALNLKSPPKGLDEENRAHVFCFLLNRNQMEKMFFLGRSVSLILGVSIGLLLFLGTRSFGPIVTFFALSLWAFDPTILAWAPTVKTDVPAVFFAYAAAFFFIKSRRSPHIGWSLLSGVILGMAATTKMSCFSLFPACLILEFTTRRPYQNLWRRWFLILLGFSVWLGLLYAPGFFQYPFPWTPFHELLERFRLSASYFGHVYPPFLFGQVSNHGLWFYYLVAFFLKSTITFSALLLLGIGLLLARKIRTEAYVWLFPIFLVVPMATFTWGSLRYLLPAQPFLILIAAFSAQWLWNRPPIGQIKIFRYVAVFLLVAHVLSVAASFPRHLSYFNDAIPQNRRIHLLGGSEFDCGQDYKRLAKTAEQNGWKHIKLASESMTDPSVYGILWNRWTQKDLEGPQSGWVYVTSAAFLQSAPSVYPQTYPIAMSWVRHLAPTRMVGDTLIIHEMPGEISKKDETPLLNSMPYFNYPDPLHPSGTNAK